MSTTPVVYNGFTFSPTGRSCSGLKYKGAVGLEVDKQQITIAARPTDLDQRRAIPDRAARRRFRRRVVSARPRVPDRAGRSRRSAASLCSRAAISTVDHVGRTQATVTVAQRSRHPRLRHAAQPLFADLRPHALRLGLRRRPRHLRGERRRSARARRRTRSTSPARWRSTPRARSSSRRASTPTCARRSRASPSASSLISDVSAAVRARDRRRLHRLCGLRPHAGDLPGHGSTISPTSAASPTCRRRRWLTEACQLLCGRRREVAPGVPTCLIATADASSPSANAPPSSRPRAPGSARPTITWPTSRASASTARCCWCASIATSAWSSRSIRGPTPRIGCCIAARSAISASCSRARIRSRAPDAGDVILFRIGRCFAHGGIVTRTEPLTIVHAFAPARRVLEEEIVAADPSACRADSRAARFASYWGMRLMAWLRSAERRRTPDYTALQLQTSVSTLADSDRLGAAPRSRRTSSGTPISRRQQRRQGGGKGGLFGGGAAPSVHLYRRPHHGPLRRADRAASASIWKDQAIYTLASSASAIQRHDAADDLAVPRGDLSHKALAYQGTAYVWRGGLPARRRAPRSAITISRSSGILAGSGRQRHRRRPGAGHPRFPDQSAIWLRLRSGQHQRHDAVAQSPGDASLQSYCKAMGIAFSPALVNQEQASSILARWLQILNCAAVWSGGELKFIPYGDTAITIGRSIRPVHGRRRRSRYRPARRSTVSSPARAIRFRRRGRLRLQRLAADLRHLGASVYRHDPGTYGIIAAGTYLFAPGDEGMPVVITYTYAILDRLHART